VTKWPSASSKKLSETIRSVTEIATKPIKLFFQDESRFGRISQAIKCWSPVGQRPVIPSQLVREYIYAYGAVCPLDGDFVSLILPDMRTECLNVFLKETSQRYPDNHIVMVMDGAASHRSGDLQVPEHMTLVHLPPYSPELNPQECVWKEIKPEGFYNRVFNTLDEVEAQLVKVLRQFEQAGERLKKLTAWQWILNALV
jgi:transposase